MAQSAVLNVVWNYKMLGTLACLLRWVGVVLRRTAIGTAKAYYAASKKGVSRVWTVGKGSIFINPNTMLEIAIRAILQT
jgi:hypothetical protein